MKSMWVAGLSLFLSLGLIGAGDKIQAAGQYPVKPIVAIVGIEAGGGGDVKTRPLFEKASKILGKPIVVVNKPGAGQTIAWRELYQSQPDGYTIGSPTLTIITAKLQGLYDRDYRDFTLICRSYYNNPILIASTKTKAPFKTIGEVLSFAKSHPGEITVATTAVGGAYWIAAQLFQEKTGLKYNLVPQEGSGGFVVLQVAGGHTDLGIMGADEAKAQIGTGNVRPLAVLGPQRFSGKFSQIPTMRELGYDISVISFGGVIGPPKMPKDVVDKLVKTFEIAGKDSEYLKFLVANDNFPEFLGPNQFLKFCDEERQMYRKVFERAGRLKEK
jgi:tripartite-type tricarboxylate transporter receptor subunit TctC